MVQNRLRDLAKQPAALPSCPPPYGKAYQIVKDEERRIMEQDTRYRLGRKRTFLKSENTNHMSNQN